MGYLKLTPNRSLLIFGMLAIMFLLVSFMWIDLEPKKETRPAVLMRINWTTSNILLVQPGSPLMHCFAHSEEPPSSDGHPG